MSFRSGFVSVVGRPNVGKSTLVNRLVGRKVSIVSERPQTTRTQIRGVRTTAAHQIVFLDTPGVHKPRTLLGERANERALATLAEVDAVCFVVDAHAAIGPGDRFVARRLESVGTPVVLACNKTDVAAPAAIARQLAAAAALGNYAAYVPVSARTGDGIGALVAELEARLPPGPHYYPPDVVTDASPRFLAAELVARDGDLPGPAAHVAVLDERALGPRIDVELDRLEAPRAVHLARVVHDQRARSIARSSASITRGTSPSAFGQCGAKRRRPSGVLHATPCSWSAR